MTLLEVGDLALSVDGVPVLHRIDLALDAGQALGIVGESGSGKSMTLRCLARIEPPLARTGGRVLLDGTDVLALSGEGLRAHRRGLGMVFQDPRAAINPVRRVGDFLTERARDGRLGLADARRRAVGNLSRMGVRDPERRMRQYPFELSGGLLQRVMIASVLMERPRLILADEPTTALDVTTQSDVLALTDELRRENGTAMLFVTHDLDLAMAICDRITVVYAGVVLETADAAVVADRPVHPYTRGLLASRPPLARRLVSIPTIPGTPLSAAQAGAGCPFASRCPVRLPVCDREFPAPLRLRGTEVRCHRAAEIATGALDGLLPLRDAEGAAPAPRGRTGTAGTGTEAGA